MTSLRPSFPTSSGLALLGLGVALALGACRCQPPLEVAPPLPPGPGAGASGGLLVRPPIDPAERAVQLAEQKKARDARWLELQQRHKSEPPDSLWARADEQEKDQSWQDAENALVAFTVHHVADARAPLAAQRAMLMAFRRGEYGEGFQLAEDALLGLDDKLRRARFARVLGNAYLAVPHWGTTRGGEFLRGRAEQGKQVQTHREDRARAPIW